MLDRGLAGPGAQGLGSLAELRIPATQRAEHRAAQVARRRIIAGRKDDLDAITGGEKDDFRTGKRRAQVNEARFDFGLGNGKARHVLSGRVAI